MIIKVANQLPQNSPKSYIAVSTNAGAATIPVKNTNTFQPSWAIQFGEIGQEQSEIAILGTSSVAGTSISLLGTTRFDHPEDTPVYAIKYDSVVFERSTSGTSGTATPITNGTVTIQPDSQVTQFDDTASAITYAYKTKYYNSALGVYSSESDWITTAGYSFYSLARLRERAKGKFYNAAFIRDPDDWNDWANEWYEQMNNKMVDVNESYAIGTVDIGFSGTASMGTITNSDFKFIKRVWMTPDGISFAKASPMDMNELMPDQTFNNTTPYYSMMDNNVLQRFPSDASGTARIVYQKQYTPLVNDTDELPVVMRGYTKSFIDYMQAQGLNKDGKNGDTKQQEAISEMNNFGVQIAPQVRSGNEVIQIVDEIEDSEIW